MDDSNLFDTGSNAPLPATDFGFNAVPQVSASQPSSPVPQPAQPIPTGAPIPQQSMPGSPSPSIPNAPPIQQINQPPAPVNSNNNIFNTIPTGNGQPVNNNVFNAPNPADPNSNNNNPQPMQNPHQNAFWDSLDVINRNFASVANGGLQFAAQGLSALGINTDGLQKNLAMQQAQHEQDYNQAMSNNSALAQIPGARNTVDILSKIGSAISTPGSQPLLGGGATAAGRILGTAGASGLTGGMEYVPGGSTQQRLDNAASATALGGLAQGGGEALASGISSAAKSLFNTPVQEAADSANKGLLTTVGSATGNDILQGTEDILGRMPYVGARGRINQQVANLRDEATNTMDNIGGLNQSKVDLGDNMMNDIQNSYKTATQNTNAAYDNAFNIAQSKGLNLELGGTQKVAQDALDRINQLKDAGISSAGAGSSKATNLLNDIVNLPEGQVPAMAFDSLRKQIGSTIDGLKRGGGDSESLPIFQQLKNSMDSDLSVNSSQDHEFGTALNNARDIYTQQKAPFKNIDVLNNAVNGKIDSDQLLNMISKNDRPVMTNNIMNALNDQGKQSFTTAIVNKAAKDAIAPNGIMDLGRLNSNLHNLGETLDSLPTPQRMQLQGLQRLLTRADSMIRTEKLSSSSLSNWIGGGAEALGSREALHLGGLPYLLGATGITKGLGVALTSPTVTKQLIKLAGGKMGPEAEDGIIKSAMKTMFQKGTIPAAASQLGTSGYLSPPQSNPSKNQQSLHPTNRFTNQPDKLGIGG